MSRSRWWRENVVRPRFWATAYILWLIVLCVASSISGIPGPQINHVDKVEHAVYFAAGHLVLGMAIALRWQPRNRACWVRIGLVLVLTAAVVGALDEFHQSFTPNRSGNDPGDFAADVMGGLLAAGLLPWAHRHICRIAR